MAGVDVGRGARRRVLQGCLEPILLFRRADVPDRQREELLARVAVVAHGRLVDREEAQRLGVVDPHRLGVGLEQQAVAVLAVSEPLLAALAVDRHRDLGRHELEDRLVRLPVADPLGVALGHEHADRVVPDRERHAEPVDRGRADQLHVSPPLELAVHLGRDEQRRPGSEYVFGQPLARPFRGEVAVVLVDEIWEADDVALRVVQRDVEVVGRHQPTHDLVDRAEQFVERLGAMGRLGDTVGRALDAVRAASLGDVAVRHHDRGNRGLPEAVHRHGFEVAPGAVLVAGAQLRALRLARSLSDLPQERLRRGHVVGVNELERLAPDVLLVRVTQDRLRRLAGVEHGAVGSEQRDDLGRVLDQGPESPLTRGQGFAGRRRRGGRGGRGRGGAAGGGWGGLPAPATAGFSGSHRRRGLRGARLTARIGADAGRRQRPPAPAPRSRRRGPVQGLSARASRAARWCRRDASAAAGSRAASRGRGRRRRARTPRSRPV